MLLQSETGLGIDVSTSGTTGSMYTKRDSAVGNQAVEAQTDPKEVHLALGAPP